ncbi:multidrug transporter subunit MdtD [Bordetella bronchialis]|uniref:EmrB/QacA subfamily drug resistance transporter n=1 Tax=Bordetella bronchialis TaxID=463025 RepID=A0ABN4R5V8_9BORD|nr:multidrug transporter subunit MdtD [Bordetella bronchialis]ANN66661.1 EmrB/QacA subfamily drug resistance transporter [Bordetella bronchialis]
MKESSSHRGMLWVVAAGFFMQSLDATIVNTALPAMAESLHELPLAMRPVIVAYSLSMAMLTPASGWLADRFGTRRVYFTSILIFVLGSLFCAMAANLTQLVIARVVQGVGGSMLLPIGRLAVLRAVRGDAYIAALALISIAGQVGPMIGPMTGGWLVQVLSWHWIFLINIPIGIVGLIAVRRYVPAESAASVPGFDFVGFTLLSTCMVAFSLGMEGTEGPDRALYTAGLMALSAFTVMAYVAYARHRPRPLFRLGLFRDATFSMGLVGNLVSRIGSSGVAFLLPLLLQLQLGYEPFYAGMMLFPVALAALITKRWVAPLVRHYGYETFLSVNTVVVGLSIMSFAFIAPGWPLLLQIVQLAIFGGSNSMQFAAMNSVTLKGLSVEDAGSGNSLFSMVQMLALSLGVSLSGGLVGLFSHGPHADAWGFRWTFICVGGVTLLSTLIFKRLDVDTARSGA